MAAAVLKRCWDANTGTDPDVGRVSRVGRDGRAGTVECQELYIAVLAGNGGWAAAGHAVAERQNGHHRSADGDHWGAWIWATH